MNYLKVSHWLLIIMALIVVIIAIGGITRLTDSGLSIVEWKPISGVLPPLNDDDWNNEFDKYKLYPEYKTKNLSLTLSEFKYIFWWEYIHRLLGRIIGLFAIIPYLFFLVKKRLTSAQKKNYFIIILLIGIQGVIGWLMVKTGLNSESYNNLGVSHFYLSLHLGIALLTYCYVFWQYLSLKRQYLVNSNYIGGNPGVLIFILLFVQIILGSMLSGLNGGLVSHTYPLMNGEFFPSNATYSLKDPFFIHFLHRWFPVLVSLFIVFIYRKKKEVLSLYQISQFRLLFYTICFQIIIGISTVILSVPIEFALLHQLGAVLMITLSTTILFSFNNK
mgnify:CR=1 FL=1